MATHLDLDLDLQAQIPTTGRPSSLVPLFQPFDFDLHGYDYLDLPNENLICPICRNPFVDPVMCESSDHIFCRLCLIRALEHSSTCPIDRLPLSLSLVLPAPKIVSKLVDELLVRCPFHIQRGCQFVCHRDLVAAHVNSNVCRQTPSPSVRPPATTIPIPSPSSSSLTRSPHEPFGSPYLPPPEATSTAHPSPPPVDSNVCRYAPVAPLLDAYAALELRNADLCAQLAHVLAQRDELSAFAASCEARLRQLWLAHSPSPPLLSACGAVAGCMSPVRRSSDSALHTSRMNYDLVNGGRLAGLPQGQPICALGSPAVRVSSFVRRGELVTPADERPPLKHTAIPNIVTHSAAEESVPGRGALDRGTSEAGLKETIGELVGEMYASLERLEGGGAAVEGDVRGVLGKMAEVWKQMSSLHLHTQLPASVVGRCQDGDTGGTELGSGVGGVGSSSNESGTGSVREWLGSHPLSLDQPQQQQQRTSIKL